MKNCFNFFLTLVFLLITVFSCRNNSIPNRTDLRIRPLKDTVGFAQYPWQMDSLMARMIRAGWKQTPGPGWKLAICPHDDYTYVGSLYPELLQRVKATNLILIGVAHKAARLHIEDTLVFDSYSAWKGPWKNVPVSPVREEIYNLLKGKYAVLNDTLQKVEHSVEAMIPYLQYFNKDINIIPILVPAMNPDRMEACGKALSEVISVVAENHKWEWGKDFAIVVTTDAVHYGNQDWGGADMAYFGCDEKGNIKARNHEKGIIDSCFTGNVTTEKIRLFNSLTLDPKNFHDYKWTWCGRYSVPVAMYTAYYLTGDNTLSGELSGYSTNITSPHISVDDIRMGRTAIATDCHWVGYAALGYTLEDTDQMGLVTLSTINLRKEPHHSAELISQSILGTPVKILKTEDSWLRIETPDNYTGWIEEASVKRVNKTEMMAWKKAQKVIYLDNTGWLYNSSSGKEGVIGDIVGGSIVEKAGESADYITVKLPDGRKGYVEKRKVMDFDHWKSSVSCNPDNVCSMSLTYMGLPYLWGGTSTKGVDCSGFVQSVFFRNGIILRRDASLQAVHGSPVDISDGFSRLKKGDLLFFGPQIDGKPRVTHVALYLGDNEYINSSGRVQINSLDSAKGNYNKRKNSILMAKRVFGVEGDPGIEPVNKHLWY